MKVIPIALAAHYATGSTTYADAMVITRTDGQIFRFTGTDRDSVIGGQTYSAAQGLDASSIVQSAGLSVDNLELTTIDDGTLFDVLDINAGIWRNAKFLIFRYNYESPSDGIDPLLAGTFGEITTMQSSIKIELRGLQQGLQQTVGNVSTKTCRARLADYPTPAGNNLCRLEPEPWTVTGSITSVTSQGVFADSGRAEAEDWFTEGIIEFTSGANAGLPAKVRKFASGQFELSIPMVFDVEVGDTYTVIAGCTKRWAEDCVAKFDNGINFQGEPHRPGIDALTASPVPDAR